VPVAAHWRSSLSHSNTQGAWLASEQSSERMAKRQSKIATHVEDVKATLADFDRAGLLGLVHDLYDSHRNNQAFLPGLAWAKTC
jgi:hypothetical protein